MWFYLCNPKVGNSLNSLVIVTFYYAGIRQKTYWFICAQAPKHITRAIKAFLDVNAFWSCCVKVKWPDCSYWVWPTSRDVTSYQKATLTIRTNLLSISNKADWAFKTPGFQALVSLLLGAVYCTSTLLAWRQCCHGTQIFRLWIFLTERAGCITSVRTGK